MLTIALTAILGIFILNTANNSLVIDAPSGGEPSILYYGEKLDDLQMVVNAGYKGVRAYPAYGLIGTEETAIAITQADGNVTLNLKITDVSKTFAEGNETLSIIRKDAYYPVTVKNVYTSYKEQDIIAIHTEIVNDGETPIVLNRYFSGCMPIRVGNVWISSIYGTWANEGRVCTEPLTRGFKVIKNIDGTRNSHTSHAEVMISLDGKPRENSGRVIGAALAWPGNYLLEFQTDDTDYHRFLAGICPENAAYTLTPSETFTTPDLLFSFSDEGMSGISRNYHKWGRKYVLAHGNTPRKILLNSWEGVYFDINESGMEQMMNDISSMGGELFVMDDGWFGDKYPRRTDNSSLGDWVVDRKKLPHGIGSLVKTADKYGIKFGIWIEPEMTNNPSELYEKHPDWVLKAANRDLVYGRGRTQLVLDLCNPEVQDFVFGVVDNLLSENPKIDYIKWDSNMPISAHGSQYLKNQNHLNVEYWRGFRKVMDRVRAKYPDITIQCCASGGGRVNWGALKGFDEFWVSDNTDALQRIFMQWGTSYFFPAIAMGQHISAVPNHTVFRSTSMKFRVDVAMSGRLGMEIQPKNMSDSEKDFCRKAITDYKRIRPVVQFGDIYRLVSPDDGLGVASLMYVSSNKDSAVFYWYKLENMYDAHLPRIKMAGLDPSRQYKVTELNRIDLTPLPFEGQTFSGRFLMDNGLEIPYNHNVNYPDKCEWSSRVLLLE